MSLNSRFNSWVFWYILKPEIKTKKGGSMHFILTLGVPGTGPYGEINNLRSYIKDYREHIRNIKLGVEKGGKKAIKDYEEGIKERRAQIREIQDTLKKKKSVDD
jgi:hypothetical protein